MTLRHIVMWKMAGDTRDMRDANASEAIAALEPLRESIPSVRALSTHRNDLFEGANYDLVLVADFDDADGLAEYAGHPEHLPVIDLMKSLTVGRAAVDVTL